MNTFSNSVINDTLTKKNLGTGPKGLRIFRPYIRAVQPAARGQNPQHSVMLLAGTAATSKGLLILPWQRSRDRKPKQF